MKESEIWYICEVRKLFILIIKKKPMRQLLFISSFILVVSCDKNHSEICNTPISVKPEIIRTFDTEDIYCNNTLKL